MSHILINKKLLFLYIYIYINYIFPYLYYSLVYIFSVEHPLPSAQAHSSEHCRSRDLLLGGAKNIK